MNILFLGGGNMASAMLSGLLARNISPTQIHVVDISEAARRAAQGKGCAVYASLVEAPVEAVDVIVLATKPQTLKEAVSPLSGRLQRQLIVSICAGVRVQTIAAWLGGYENIVRTMPNTPALIGQGITGMYAPATVGASARAVAQTIVASMGAFCWFDAERMLDAVTAVSGSGPAYVFYFMEAMMQAARDLGFTEAQAREFTYATFAGAVQLAQRSDEPAAVLRERVTSKGGTTAAALASMANDHVTAAIVRAIHAADARARELGEIMASQG